jgi:hypothetical protein
MSPEESIYAARNSADISLRPPEALRPRLALMLRMQASLFGSRTALLALDLAGIEQGTREQVELSLKLEEEIGRGGAPAANVKTLTRHGAAGFTTRAPKLESELEKELRRCEHEVLQALRLQSALLVRARSKLRVLSNMLAGTSVNYGPPLTRSVALARVFDFDCNAGGEI